MVRKGIRGVAAAVLGIVAVGTSCLTPTEARLAKLGSYHVKLDFTEEVLRDENGGRFIGATKGEATGMLLLRPRTVGPAAGSGQAVEAEFLMVSCAGLYGEFCSYANRFKSDTIWGGTIDTPEGGDGRLQVLLAGATELYIELDGAFESGEFRGTVIWRRRGFCCGNPTAEFARGRFHGAK
jgi:hypothetical protein